MSDIKASRAEVEDLAAPVLIAGGVGTLDADGNAKLAQSGAAHAVCSPSASVQIAEAIAGDEIGAPANGHVRISAIYTAR
jgi:hypothetical protein